MPGELWSFGLPRIAVPDEPRLRPDRWPRVGGFRYLVRDERWEWSDEVAQMHGYAPGTITPTTELVLAHRHPDDKATVGDLVVQVYRQRNPCHLSTPDYRCSRQRALGARGR
jgi:hypothetical protein